MNNLLRSRIAVLVGGLLLLAWLTPATVAHAESPGNPHLTVQTIGNPAWTIVDPHVFAAPIGTASDGFAEFGETAQAILPPPHYQPISCLGIGPGTPEQPPYDHDLGDGIATGGYPQRSSFAPEQFSNGVGVWLVFMVVPSPTSQNVGSSPDFASGPMIPNSLFPIKVASVTNRDSAPYDPNLANFSVPAINTQPCPGVNVDGNSHFPIFIAENSEAAGQLGTRLHGTYTFNVTMQDSAGNGYSLSTRFEVTSAAGLP
jgi:hypothetical protein